MSNKENWIPFVATTGAIGAGGGVYLAINKAKSIDGLYKTLQEAKISPKLMNSVKYGSAKTGAVLFNNIVNPYLASRGLATTPVVVTKATPVAVEAGKFVQSVMKYTDDISGPIPHIVKPHIPNELPKPISIGKAASLGKFMKFLNVARVS